MSGRGKKKRSSLNSELKWNTGVYTRRSFDDLDDNESNTIINQKGLVCDYIKNIPNMHIIDYYIDDGYTGTNFNRPDFQRMMKDVASGRINAIIVKDLSRLGRNYIEVGKYIEQIFPIYNLRIIAINDDVDSFLRPESINGLIVPMKNLINESYSKDVSKKVRSAYQTMAKKGKFVAGTSPYGYTFDKNDKHHLVINPEEAPIVKIIFNMALNGNGRIFICKYLNDNGILCRKEIQRRKKQNLSLDPFKEKSRYLWCTTTIGRMLKNVTYLGNLAQLRTKNKSYKNKQVVTIPEDDWVRFNNTHEAIITKSCFNKVQKIIKSNTKGKKRKKSSYSIYKGKLKCNDCGKAMCKQEDTRGTRNLSHYFCSNYLRSSNLCKPHKIKTSTLDTLILKSIQLQVKLVIDLDRSIKKLFFKSNANLLENEYKNSVKIAEMKIENLKQQKRENYESWKFNMIDKSDFFKVSDDIESKIKKLNEDIELYHSTYQETIKKIRKDDYWISHFKRNKKIKKLTKEVLDELIDKIFVCQDGNIKVIFKYQDEYLSLLNYLEQERGVEKCENGVLTYT